LNHSRTRTRARHHDRGGTYGSGVGLTIQRQCRVTCARRVRDRRPRLARGCRPSRRCHDIEYGRSPCRTDIPARWGHRKPRRSRRRVFVRANVVRAAEGARFALKIGQGSLYARINIRRACRQAIVVDAVRIGQFHNTGIGQVSLHRYLVRGVVQNQEMPFLPRLIRDIEKSPFPHPRRPGRFRIRQRGAVRHGIIDCTRGPDALRKVLPHQPRRLVVIVPEIGKEHLEKREVVSQANTITVDDIRLTVEIVVRNWKVEFSFLPDTHACIRENIVLQYRHICRVHDLYAGHGAPFAGPKSVV